MVVDFIDMNVWMFCADHFSLHFFLHSSNHTFQYNGISGLFTFYLFCVYYKLAYEECICVCLQQPKFKQQKKNKKLSPVLCLNNSFYIILNLLCVHEHVQWIYSEYEFWIVWYDVRSLFVVSCKNGKVQYYMHHQNAIYFSTFVTIHHIFAANIHFEICGK